MRTLPTETPLPDAVEPPPSGPHGATLRLAGVAGFSAFSPQKPKDAGTPAFPVVSGYEFLAVVGGGGMGVVYKARHRGLNRIVALKMLGRPWEADTDSRERFRGEAEAVARLQHPNIIQLFDIGEYDRGGAAQPYMSLEYVEGGTLARFVGTPQEPRFAAGMVAKLARAAGAAHKVGVIHRDLKPANVLLTAGGEPKIADFGLAKQLQPLSDDSGRYRTQAGMVVGTPEYMPPEQVDGKPPTPAMDVYALGVILYELLTGRVPLKGANLTESLLMARLSEPVPPRQLVPKLPRDLETICLKCLAKQPEKRYATADELADDLGRWADGKAIRARPVGRGERAARWARRNPAVAGLLAFSLLLLLAGVSGVVWKWQAATASAAEAERVAAVERWERYRANVRAASSAIELGNIAAARAALADAPDEHRGWEWRVLDARLDASSRTLRIPGLTQFAFTGQSVGLATVAERTIQPWDLASGRPTGPAVAASAGSLGIRESGPNHWFPAADGRDAAAVEADFSVRLVSFTGGPERRLVGHTDRPTAIQFAAGHVATGSEDGTARVWDRATGRLLATRTLFGPVAVQGISADGSRVALSDTDHIGLAFWTVAADTMTTVKGIRFEDGRFSPDGRRFVIGRSYPDNDLRLFDTDTGREVKRLKGHRNSVLVRMFNRAGTLLVTAGLDHTARLWDAATGEPRGVLEGHGGWVQSVAFAPCGRLLATGCADKAVRLWTTAGELLATLRGHERDAFEIGFSADGKELYSYSADGTVRAWDVAAARRRGLLRGHTGFVYDVAAHPDGRHAVSAAWDGTAVLWDLNTGTAVRRFAAPAQGDRVNHLNSVAVHPNGRWAALSGRLDTVFLWDLHTGETLHTWAIPTDDWRVGRLAFHPTGDLLACGGKDGQVHLIDPGTRKSAGVLRGDGEPVSAVAFSPDGNTLAAGTERAWLWDVRTRQKIAEWNGPTGRIQDLAFSPDGSTLAAAADSDVFLWDAARRTAIGALPHGVRVHAVAFHPTGNRLVAGCDGGSVRVWDTSRWQEVAELPGHRDYIRGVTFTAGGDRMITGSGDHTVRVWDIARAGR